MSSNSALTYNIGLLQDQTINVKLTGEAWFEAESSVSDEFSVIVFNTPDGLITDIGTKFLVSVQDDLTRVVKQDAKRV